MEDNRTLAQLAEEVLAVQDACNLSGVVISWERSIRRLRVLLTAEHEFSTSKLNEHPINMMWASKAADLTRGTMQDFSEAYYWCERIAKGEN